VLPNGKEQQGPVTAAQDLCSCIASSRQLYSSQCNRIRATPRTTLNRQMRPRLSPATKMRAKRCDILEPNNGTYFSSLDLGLI
jgi:hypothetical protein